MINNLPLVVEGIMAIDADGRTTLIGSRAADGELSFPPRLINAGTDLVNLGSDGTLHVFTTIHTRPPFGLPQPYSVGYVDLLSVSLRIFALLGNGPLQCGSPVGVTARAIGVGLDGKPCLRPVFEMVDRD